MKKGATLLSRIDKNRREPSSEKKRERHVPLKYEASPRITKAACAIAQTNTDGFELSARNSASRQHDVPVRGRMFSDDKSFFFQPASRVMQEETHHLSMVSRANTCDYLI
ncbi:MAG: hypothetical protein ACRC46_02670 [Thermoguttaceae bacterium]